MRKAVWIKYSEFYGGHDGRIAKGKGQGRAPTAASDQVPRLLEALGTRSKKIVLYTASQNTRSYTHTSPEGWSDSWSDSKVLGADGGIGRLTTRLRSAR